MHSTRALIAIAAVLCLNLSGPGPARAQSTESSEPTVLTSNQFNGEAESNGQSFFYSFTGGPGDVTINLDGTTDSGSSTMHVVFTDDEGRQLADVPVSASGSGGKKIAKLHLTKKQRVTVQLLFGYDVGVRVNYKVQLAGAVALSGNAIASGATGTTAPPHIAAAAKPSPTSIASVASVATTRELPVKTPVTVVRVQPANAQAQQQDDDETSELMKVVNSPIEDKWALVVGISKFQKDAINLKYPAKDAKDLYTYLLKEGNFAADHVKLLVDEQATKERVLDEIGDKWLPRLARPNDLVLIFISSHGSPSNLDLEGLNYLVMHNTDPDRLFSTGLPMQELASVIKTRVHAKRVVVIVDACHSGAANPAKGIKRVGGNFDGNALSQGTGQLVICSSEPNQVSWESTRYENGVFTHQLIEALRAGSGKASLGQAFERMKESVLSEVLHDRKEVQMPVMKSRWQGEELILSAPPARPRVVPQDMLNQ